MAMVKPSPPRAWLDTDIETTEEDTILGSQHVQAPRGRSGCRLVAGVAGTLLVVAVMSSSMSSSAKQGASECVGSSCVAQSDHLDKVLELKQNTMGPELCPLGYYGTPINIKGKGKQWSRGNLTDCGKVCDEREGCLGFEFHDKNGKCGTYTDGYILGGPQAHRWLTCVREGTNATNVMFTVKNLDFATFIENSTAKEAFENGIQEVIGALAGVPPHRVGVDFSQGSVKVSATIAEGNIDKDAAQLKEALDKASDELKKKILEKLKEIADILGIAEGDLTIEEFILTKLENWDARTTTAPAGSTTGA